MVKSKLSISLSSLWKSMEFSKPYWLSHNVIWYPLFKGNFTDFDRSRSSNPMLKRAVKMKRISQIANGTISLDKPYIPDTNKRLNDYVRKITDDKYGPGACEYIQKPFAMILRICLLKSNKPNCIKSPGNAHFISISGGTLNIWSLLYNPLPIWLRKRFDINCNPILWLTAKFFFISVSYVKWFCRISC